MIKKINTYKKELDAALSIEMTAADKERLLTELLVKTGFFQHERLVHLIVTMTVAVLCTGCTIVLFLFEAVPAAPALLILTGLFYVLLVPYIIHYYRLENAVQSLYQYYDKLK